MKYIEKNITLNSTEEHDIFEMVQHYFSVVSPYERTLSDEVKNDFLTEIRKGEITVAQTENDPLAGLAITCHPDLDKRIKSYASKHQCQHYLAALIIKEKYRGKGHAINLYNKACEGKDGNMLLVTPEDNIAAVNLYKKLGFTIISKFDQTEISLLNGEKFNLRRLVMINQID